MSDNQINPEEKKAQRKLYWASFRQGFKQGAAESFTLVAKASIVTSTVIITVMSIHLLSGRKLLPTQ